ncbi:hypothetical protein QAD02_010453 [Eretmocerus hayati]|uniref:Uncharacterized protein n=1 Tax=Eretmocerus hayati TaxID=131215 RepID=A0ACC2NWT2_9HYME|nr:hypothetical protein QAD02_010453 [Eretmocerus hayati]
MPKLHRPLRSVRRIEKSKRHLFKVNKLKENLAKACETELDNLPLDIVDQVEAAAEKLEIYLRKAYEDSMLTREAREQKNTFWDDGLKDARRESLNVRREAQKQKGNRTADVLAKLKEKRLAYEGERKVKSDASFQRFVWTVGNEKPWGYVYRYVTDKLQNRSGIPLVKGPNGP